MINVSDLKPGVTFQLDGNLYVVLDYSHNKTARAAANIKVKMNSMGNISFKPENTLIAKINGMGNLNLLGNDVLDNVEAHLNSMGRLKGGNITTRRLSITGKSNQCDIEVVSPSKKNKL